MVQYRAVLERYVVLSVTSLRGGSIIRLRYLGLARIASSLSALAAPVPSLTLNCIQVPTDTKAIHSLQGFQVLFGYP